MPFVNSYQRHPICIPFTKVEEYIRISSGRETKMNLLTILHLGDLDYLRAQKLCDYLRTTIAGVIPASRTTTLLFKPTSR